MTLRQRPASLTLSRVMFWCTAGVQQVYGKHEWGARGPDHTLIMWQSSGRE